MKKSRRTAVLLLIVMIATGLAGCKKQETKAWSPGEQIDKDKIKIGVIYLDNAESGWSYAHELGIQRLQRELQLRDDQIIRKFEVNDSDNVIIEYNISEALSEGANIIIATSWGFMDVCEQMAAEHPHIIFAHASGYKSNDVNFTNYFGRIYLARYLAGIAAGLRTETGKVGFVAAQDNSNSEVTGGLNAFAIGVESVNPDARVYVSVTHSWYHPSFERNSARALISAGCDVITQHCDTIEPQLAAEQAGVWGIGWNLDTSDKIKDTLLTSVIWNWGAYYTFLISSVIDGSFTTTPYFGGLADGLVDLAPLNGALVAPGTEAAIAEARGRILNEGFNVFDGLIETNDGRRIGAEGGTLSDEEITGGIDWYYRNVVTLD